MSIKPIKNKKWKQGEYIPINKDKCLNYEKGLPVIFRSSWELKFYESLDLSPKIKKWGSEIIRIPYVNPLNKKGSIYVPDVYYEYMELGELKRILCEIKPAKETYFDKTKNNIDKLVWLKNQFKWASAISFCKKRGIIFKIQTENS